MQLDPTYYEDDSAHYFIPKPSGNEAVFYYPVSLGYFNCKPTYHVQRNIFSSYLLIVMLTGSLSYQTRRSMGVARPGTALLLDCNEPHSYAALGKCSFTFIHFTGAQSRALYEEIEAKGGNLIHLQDASAVHEGIGTLLSAMQEDGRFDETQASVLIYSMLMTLLKQSSTQPGTGTGNPIVDKAITHIQTHLTDNLSVDEIAASTGYSASYFSHIFAAETGMSPYQFVVRSRVEHAQLLLKTTRHSVQEIAFQCGFNSAANFCYTFRKMTGISPHAYRKRPL